MSSLLGTLVLWSFMAYGMSTILVYGTIFDKPRDWIKLKSKFFGALISCMMCTSTWVGFFLGIFLVSPTNYLFGTNQYISWFFDGCLASGAVWAINAIIEWYEQNRPK